MQAAIEVWAGCRRAVLENTAFTRVWRVRRPHGGCRRPTSLRRLASARTVGVAPRLCLPPRTHPRLPGSWCDAIFAALHRCFGGVRDCCWALFTSVCADCLYGVQQTCILTLSCGFVSSAGRRALCVGVWVDYMVWGPLPDTRASRAGSLRRGSESTGGHEFG